MKTIVTHISPDLDAISSVWLIKKFLPGWKNAQVKFVPAGSTLNKMLPDIDQNIIHVDTGMGKFDHHHTAAFTCAAKLVFDYLAIEGYIKDKYQKPLERMVSVFIEFDHFREVFLKNADADIYDLLLVNLIDGLKVTQDDDYRVLTFVEEILNGLLQIFCNKVYAEKEIEKSYEFNTKYGIALACESDNEEVSKLAQKKGYHLVIRKGVKKGHIRIKSLPLKKINLKKLYDVLIAADQTATWFYHASGHMILNGSAKNPDSIPTKLSLSQVVSLIKKLY